jgi:TonB family protein
MKRLASIGLLIWLTAGCSANSRQPLCPKHIETPDFPPDARAAHVTGEITLTISIDADGRVKNVEATSANPVERAHPLLQKHAIENMHHWTFARPSSAPYIQTIVYDYEFDDSLPPEGGASSLPAITKVNFDLPDHVAILTNLRIIDVSSSREHD